MKSLLLSLIVFSAAGFAQTLQGLFNSDGFVPNLVVPFEVVATGDANVQQIFFDVNEAQCKSLKDSFYPTIFHVRCKKPGIARLRVVFSDGVGFKTIVSPDLNFKFPAGGVIVDEDGGGLNPEQLAGKNIHTTNECAKCHTTKWGTSVPELLISFEKAQMTQFKNKFTADELKKLSAYLRSQ